MHKKTNLTVVFGVITVICVLGIVDRVAAEPDESQRLRGMGGRVFAVQVTDLSDGSTFPNCYYFNSDGTWDDPLFPEIGTWVQHSTGASTPYTAEAVGDFGIIIQLLQQGTVTPAGGSGVLQLEALSQAIVVGGDLDGVVLAEFLSVGSEVDECPSDSDSGDPVATVR